MTNRITSNEKMISNGFLTHSFNGTSDIKASTNYIVLIIIALFGIIIGYLIFELTGVILNSIVSVILIISILTTIWLIVITTNNRIREKNLIDQFLLLDKMKNQ